MKACRAAKNALVLPVELVNLRGLFRTQTALPAGGGPMPIPAPPNGYH